MSFAAVRGVQRAFLQLCTVNGLFRGGLPHYEKNPLQVCSTLMSIARHLSNFKNLAFFAKYAIIYQ